MGDGRYYTVLQFFNTLILLILLMLITVNLVTILYQHVRREMSNWLIVLYGALGVTIMLRLAEEVVVATGLINLYSMIGRWLIILISLGIFWAIAAMVRKIYRDSTPITNGMNPDELIMLSGIFLMAIIVYGGLVLMHHGWINFYQLFYYGILAYTLNRLLALVAPYGISLRLFTYTKDMILDYVFITDCEGTIIFQNNNSETVSYFKPIKVLEIQNITSIFNRQVEHQQLRGKDYIKYDGGEDTLYFSYSVKPLLRNGTRVGGIITFTDVSGLMRLLEDLDQKNVDKERINKELQHYATIVYRLEKEKEIQQLLETIAENQEKSMLLLKEEILSAIQSKEEQGYMENIEGMILSAKENLHDVRNAVNTFRAYYGGKDD